MLQARAQKRSLATDWSPGGDAYGMNERAGAQSHFMGLCALLGVEAPNHSDDYTFEKGTLKLGQKRGFADVFKRGCFAWEYKAPGGDLTAALRQLKDYANALDNPPLLVVSDRLAFEIHTQFTGRPTETYRLALKDFGDPANRELLRRAFTSPASFQPKRTNRDITEAAAKAFAEVAERMRNERREPPERVAHFLTQCLFCFFAEDVGLLPERLFEKLVALQVTPDKLRGALIELFEKMQSGGLFGMEAIPWFNGGLFRKIDVPMITPMDVAALKTASTLNWSAIDVAIFGTLFERGLDPKKRSQLGAHYTDPATIMRIVTPVVERPLRAEWATAREEIATLRAKSKKYNDAAYLKARAAATRFLERLANYRVLDPACGSGNFLYLALKTLKDIEHSVHVDIQTMELDRPVDLVTSPANVLGIEINEYAAELARVTVWIGELQWRLQHGYPFKQNPVLEPLDHIECRDALLARVTTAGLAPSPLAGEGGGEGLVDEQRQDGTGSHVPPHPSPLPRGERGQNGVMQTVEASWPRADAVIGNPPFVGDRKMIRELGEEYTFKLREVYESSVPGGADLVCYWFEKARVAIAAGDSQHAGFVATNSIRGGANRKVLEKICESANIEEAWSDEPWVNDGAAVRVSLVAFDASSTQRYLNGNAVRQIYADLSGRENDVSTDVTDASSLEENNSTAFVGVQRNGPFDIPGHVARRWLSMPNVNGVSNAKVLRRAYNAIDLTRRESDRWLIDFALEKDQNAVALFEAAHAWVVQHVKPTREGLRRAWHANYWWLFGDPRPALRKAVAGIPRYILTPQISKHRVFVFVPNSMLTENANIAVARADDTSFGILHSRFHELWSLRVGTSLEDRPRYTNTTTFEAFPFPAGLTPRDTAHQRTEVLADGAVIPAGLAPSPLAGEGGGEGLVTAQNQLGAPTPVPPHPSPLPRGERGQLVAHAIAIARAAKRLNDLRERWLNPPEWTEAVPEVIPLGMEVSPYPDRILPRANLGAADLAELKKRTLTNLYNQRPAWLADAHAALDAAVALAYGWADYSAAMTDNEILARLLALNHERSAASQAQ